MKYKLLKILIRGLMVLMAVNILAVGAFATAYVGQIDIKYDPGDPNFQFNTVDPLPVPTSLPTNLRFFTSSNPSPIAAGLDGTKVHAFDNALPGGIHYTYKIIDTGTIYVLADNATHYGRGPITDGAMNFDVWVTDPNDPNAFVNSMSFPGGGSYPVYYLQNFALNYLKDPPLAGNVTHAILGYTVDLEPMIQVTLSGHGAADREVRGVTTNHGAHAYLFRVRLAGGENVPGTGSWTYHSGGSIKSIPAVNALGTNMPFQFNTWYEVQGVAKNWFSIEDWGTNEETWPDGTAGSVPGWSPSHYFNPGEIQCGAGGGAVTNLGIELKWCDSTNATPATIKLTWDAVGISSFKVYGSIDRENWTLLGNLQNASPPYEFPYAIDASDLVYYLTVIPDNNTEPGENPRQVVGKVTMLLDNDTNDGINFISVPFRHNWSQPPIQNIGLNNDVPDNELLRASDFRETVDDDPANPSTNNFSYIARYDATNQAGIAFTESNNPLDLNDFELKSEEGYQVWVDHPSYYTVVGY
jgi:hypothetical protein